MDQDTDYQSVMSDFMQNWTKMAMMPVMAFNKWMEAMKEHMSDKPKPGQPTQPGQPPR
jgi:hypothetical protein